MKRKTIKEQRDDGEGNTVKYWIVHEFRSVRDEETDEAEIHSHYNAEFRRAGGVDKAIDRHNEQILHLEDIAADIQHMKDEGLDVYERSGVVKA